MRIRSLPWRIVAGILASLIATSSCFAVLNRKNSAKGDYGANAEIFASAPVTFTLSDGSKFTVESRIRCITGGANCFNANAIFVYFYVVTIPSGGQAVTQPITLQLTAPFDPHNSPSLNFGILDELGILGPGTFEGTMISDCPNNFSPTDPTNPIVNTCIDPVLAASSNAAADGTVTFVLDPQTLTSHSFKPGDQIFVYATSFSPPNCSFTYGKDPITLNIAGLSCSDSTSLSTQMNVSASSSVNPTSLQVLAPVLSGPQRRMLAPDEGLYFGGGSFTGNTINAQTKVVGTTTTNTLPGFLTSTVDIAGCQGCFTDPNTHVTALNVSFGYLYNLTISDPTVLPATLTVTVNAPFNQDNFEFLSFGILGTSGNDVSSNISNCGSSTDALAYDTCVDAVLTNVVQQPQVVAGVPLPATALTFTINTSNLNAGDNLVLFATSNNKPGTCSATTGTCPSNTPVSLGGDTTTTLSIATGSPTTVVGPSDALPTPAISTLGPNTAPLNSPAFTLSVSGSNFVVGSQVQWKATPGTCSAPRQTTYASAGQLTAQIPASDLQSGGTIPVTICNPPNPSVGPNPEISGSVNFTVITPNPVPSVTSFGPASALAGGSAFTLTINGSGFVPSSVVNFSGSAKTTTFITSSSLTIPITASDIATAGSFPVTVFNPAPGGGTSTAVNFTVNNPAPTVTSLAPTTVIAGGVAFSLTVNGTGFVSGSQVKFNGSPRTTTFTSSTALTAAITAADIAAAGSATITVTNAAPGGGTSTVSAASTLAINNPVPTISSLSPSSTLAGGATFTLTVNGTSFVSGAAVSFNGKAEMTTFVSTTQLTATVPAADIATAGNVNVVVTNPAPTAGPSAPTVFVINNPAPTVTSLSPSSVTAGAAAFTLTVNGTNFVNSSKVNFNGSPRTTAFVSYTQVTASITAADVATASTANITVTNPTPGGGTSTATTFTVNNPAPSVTALSPSTVIAGSAGFTLLLTGTSFVSNSVVNFNGKAETTLFTSATQLSATIPAADIATGATVNVTVTNPSPGGGTSAAQSFGVNNPVPVLTSLGQTHIPGGAAFTLTVNGQKFVTGSVINLGTKAEPTTFVSASQLTATIPAGDVATAGTANITVSSPAPGGGPSSALSLTIDGFSASAPSAPTTVAPGQSAMFTITVAAGDANGFPNTVSFSASGVPSLASPSFSPPSVTPGATNATTTLTITTTAPSLIPPAPRARPTPLFPWPLVELSLATLLLALLAALRKKAWMPARGFALAWPAVLLMLLATVASGCAGGGGGGSVSRPGTQAGTYTITVTATSGSLSQPTNVTLIVSAH